MFSESGPTCVSPLWNAGRKLQIIPAGLPRDHLPILLTLRYPLQPKREEAAIAHFGGKRDLQVIAGSLQRRDKRLVFFSMF